MAFSIIPSKRLHRDTNLELLRFISMIFVVITHCGFIAIPHYDLSSASRNVFLFSLEFFSDVCVNSFVLISGFFSIKASVRGFISFCFQAAFIPLLIYVILSIAGVVDASFRIYFRAFDFSRYWFVSSYIGLYLLAPALNTYVLSLSKLQFSRVLIFASIIYFLLGWPYDRIGTDFGFSVISFVYLYLIGRFISIIPLRFFSARKVYYAAIYFVSSALGIVFALAALHFGFPLDKISRLFSYNSPFIISSSLAFFLFFKNLKFHCRFINILASFSFSIYLIHCHSVLFDFYLDKMKFLWDSYPLHIYILFGLLLCPLFFTLAAVVIDPVRCIAWSAALSLFSRFWHRFNQSDSL